jgi:hypothetical protein
MWGRFGIAMSMFTLIRFTATLTVAALLFNNLAFAAGPVDAAAMRAKVQARGVGQGVRVTLADQAEVKGLIVSISEQSFTVKQNEHRRKGGHHGWDRRSGRPDNGPGLRSPVQVELSQDHPHLRVGARRALSFRSELVDGPGCRVDCLSDLLDLLGLDALA